MLGLDQHEVGAIAISNMLRDEGIEVIYIGRFNTPVTIAKTGLEEDVDIIGLSCHSWEYLHYMPELLKRLKDQDTDIAVVVGGSVITPGDEKTLTEMGVTEVFGPSATNQDIIDGIRRIVAV